MFCPRCGYPMTESEPKVLTGTVGVEHPMRVYVCQSAMTGAPGARCEFTTAYVPVVRPALAGAAEAEVG